MEDTRCEDESNSVCRLCLSADKQLSHIFTETSSSDSQETLVNKILDCTSLQVVEYDGLPSKICADCNDLIDKLHTFKRRCITSFETLCDQLQKKNNLLQVCNERIGAQTSDKALQTVCSTDLSVANLDYRIGSPPPNTKWNSKAVDVEVKVEIKEAANKISAKHLNGKRNKDGSIDKLTILKDVFPCSKCSKVFAHKNSRTRHEYSHTDESFTCFYCNKKLTTRDTLLRHVKAHSGEKRYRCELCGKSYTSSTSYSSHVRKHTGERPYKCTECDQSFHLASSLDRHAAKHRGKKAFTCEVCDSSFWVADDLRSHVNRVH